MKKNKVEMPYSEFVREHNKLIKILRDGNDTERMVEARKQENELRKYQRKNG